MALLLLGGILLGGNMGPLTDKSHKASESGIRSSVISILLVVYDQSHCRVRISGELSLSGWLGIPPASFHRVQGYLARTFCHSFNPLESTLVSLDCQLQI